MIHKFWNVRLASSTDAGEIQRQLDGETDENGRNAVRDEEEKMEEKVYRIWSVLSTFEESSAACISDMLLHVSNGAYVDGVLVAKKFIFHVDILFRSADTLDATMTKVSSKGRAFTFFWYFTTDDSQAWHIPEKQNCFVKRLWHSFHCFPKPRKPEFEN
jgi:hypothetical protein